MKEDFMAKWKRFFGESPLPLVFFYSDQIEEKERLSPSKGHRCIFSDLKRVIKEGGSIAFDKESIGCAGGARYLGFEERLRPDFEYFLSCGKEGLEGERYKKGPEIVKEMMKKMSFFKAPSKFAIFKRWDAINKKDRPEIVIFFETPDVVSALYTLANFDKVEDNVICPFGSGCSQIVLYPLLQNSSPDPKCVLGLFDISARPFLNKHVFSFSIPIKRFVEILKNMDESFLITRSWKRLKKRL